MRRSRLLTFLLSCALLCLVPTTGLAKGGGGSKTEGGDTPVNISGIIGSVTGKGGQQRGGGQG